jgi:hypothetical protein
MGDSNMADQTEADRRHIYSTAKALGAEFGMIDPTDVRAIVDEFRVDEFGEVPGLKGRIETLKNERPHWFKAGDGNEKQRRRQVASPNRSLSSVHESDLRNATDGDFRAILKEYGVS